MPADIDAIMRSEEAANEPTTDQTFQHKKLISENEYVFMDNAHDGTGGFRNGEYLVPHEREMFYKARREIAYYKNYVRPILRAMIEPVFTELVSHRIAQWDDPTKEAPEGSLMSQFVEDCDGAGTHLQRFMKRVARVARLHGVSFIVMDNFPAEQQKTTKAEAKEKRAFPYVYLKKASQIAGKKGKGFELDAFGEFEWVILTDRDDHTDKSNPKRFRKWTKTDSTLMKQVSGGDKFTAIPGKSFTHGLGKVPVLMVFATEREELDKLFVNPPLYDLARLNHALFNKTSEIRTLERSQGFSIFYIQTNQQQSTMTFGDKTVLFIPEDMTIPPGFASPDAGILKGLVENEEKLREDIFRLAEQNGVTGVQSGSSGVAIQWDFFAHESILKQTSALAAATTFDVSRLFALYVPNEDFAIFADYPTDFQPNDKKAELDLYDKYLLMEDMPVKGKALAKEKATRLLFSDEDPDRVKEIVDEIKADAEDELNSKADEKDKPPEDDKNKLPFPPKEDEEDTDEDEDEEDKEGDEK
jgi:hypothetical protein